MIKLFVVADATMGVNMKRITRLALILVILLSSLNNTYASAEIVDDLSKSEEKLKAHRELVESGIIESLDNEIADYYSKNSETIITNSDFSNLSVKENEALTKELESSMLDFNTESSKASGSNTMSWSAFENGDVVLVHDGFSPLGYFRHGGTYDQILKQCVSAQFSDVGNGKGVILESKLWYNTKYDVAAGYSTRNYDTTIRSNIMEFLNEQLDEDYSATALYYTWDKWSCVKLPWVGWYEKADINIAVDVLTLIPLSKSSGICFPDSIKKSPNVFQFSYGS